MINKGDTGTTPLNNLRLSIEINNFFIVASQEGVENFEVRRRNGDRKWITEEEETFNAFSLQGEKRRK